MHDRREARDKARRQWLYRYRDSIKPLLPPSSTFFENLANEVSKIHTLFVPPHQLDVQPKSIQGGTMKEYQVVL